MCVKNQNTGYTPVPHRIRYRKLHVVQVPGTYLGYSVLQIRIRIIFGSRIQIRIRTKVTSRIQSAASRSKGESGSALLKTEPWRAMDAHKGGVEAQKWNPGGSVCQWSQILISLTRSRIRIRIGIKVKIGSGSASK